MSSILKEIKIKINGQEIICSSDFTIMQVCHDNDIDLPNLCFHPDFSVKANCRVCVVEIVGRRNLATSCSTKVEDGMEIFTDSEKVKFSRNLNIELIFAEHIEKCATCIWRVNCKLLELAKKYKIKITKFKDRKSKRKIYKFANAVEIDGTQCIDCRNCLDACNLMQKINFLELKGKGVNQEIAPVSSCVNKKVDCIYCGQCAVHCPVGAAQEQSHWQLVEKVLFDKSKIVVAQFSSAVCASIGEEFSVQCGENMTGQTVAGLKKLGFKYVFSINSSVDAVIVDSAKELVKKIEDNKVAPILSSSCPAFVKYIESYHSDLAPNLSDTCSLQMHSAELIKTYLAEKMKVNKKNVVVVSVAPCTAQKFEASRSGLKINNIFPIDYVITTREFAWLIKKNKIDFKNLESVLADSLFDKSVNIVATCNAPEKIVESIIKTAQHFLDEGKKDNSQIEFKNMSGCVGIKEAQIKIAEKDFKIAIVDGIGNIQPILKKIKEYNYIEVKACPGGCIVGGGQPFSIAPDINKKRLNSIKNPPNPLC